MKIFEELESNVRSYCRDFPKLFLTSKNDIIFDIDGKGYIDFLSGAGALNYGHNNDFIKRRLLDYIASDGIMHALDMSTSAKKDFLLQFRTAILEPRHLSYKIQCCGPTGTNAVEAALKLARKIKKRTGIFAFMGSFHGMSLGSLSATSVISKRAGAGIPLNGITFVPYPCGGMDSFDTIDYLESILTDDHSGIEKPAAILLETIQAEGGVFIAPEDWLQRLDQLCKKYDILLICDDIQVGCGRTGKFFSFERAAIVPDIVTLSKSISGYGLPMSILLMKPEHDIWKPGEHNGTFRGNQLAFVAGTAALQLRDQINLDELVEQKERIVKQYLEDHFIALDPNIMIRGMGLIWGIDFSKLSTRISTSDIIKNCFENGLIIENSGRNGSVIKILPPLTIERDVLETGLGIVFQAVKSLMAAVRIS